jgi:hypothetical protein
MKPRTAFDAGRPVPTVAPEIHGDERDDLARAKAARELRANY